MKKTLLLAHDAPEATTAKPIFLIKSGGLSDCNAPDPLMALAQANGFNGDAGVSLASEDGVLYGVGAGDDPFIAAALSEKLGAGVYSFETVMADREAHLACLAWLIGAYRFDRYKTTSPSEAILIAPIGIDVDAVCRAGAAHALTRDLVNIPANDMTPSALEASARALAEEFNAEFNVTVGDALLDEGFPMVHAVGRAASIAPRLIDFAWGRSDAPKVTLVGKGVTFDSGGLNIKGGSSMALMKKDMGGAAHVLGLARMIMSAGIDVRLRVLAPTVENAIAGNAFRPGDILASRRGLSVEIGNTDAEGRLILADALTLAGEENPDLLISLATLTGAARVALGPEVVPFYTDDEALATALSEASVARADPIWRMPFWRNYESMMSSSIADINHISTNSFAGSIIAALFLRRFVDLEPYVHFDIYAWRPKSAPGRPVGAEVQAIRALYKVIEDRYS